MLQKRRRFEKKEKEKKMIASQFIWFSSNMFAPQLLRTDKREDIVVPYRLPDGRTIELGAERFRAPEALFKPDLLGYEWPGIHELVAASIKRFEKEVGLCTSSEPSS